MMSRASARELASDIALPVVGLAAACASAALVADAGAPLHGPFSGLLVNGLLVLLPLVLAGLLAIEPAATALRRGLSPGGAALLAAGFGAAYIAAMSVRAYGVEDPALVLFGRYLVLFGLPMLVGLFLARRLGESPVGWPDVLFGIAVMILAGIKGNKMPMHVGARVNGLFVVDASYFVWLLVLAVYVVLMRRLDVGYSLKVSRDDLSVTARTLAALLCALLPVGLLIGFIEPTLAGKTRGELFFALTFYTLRVALAEELFFRAIFQNALISSCNGWLGERRGPVAGILAGGVLFGLCHLRLGGDFAALAIVAGIGYGWAYARTARLTAPVLVHGLVDVVNFAFH